MCDDDILRCTICNGKLAESVLLNCLHNVCRLCCESSDATTVMCSMCQMKTETLKTNLLISSLARRSVELQDDDLFCQQCINAEKQHVVAAWKCVTCNLSLCAMCKANQSKLHSNHNIMCLEEPNSKSQSYCLPPRICNEHREELKLACFTCKEGRCSKCAHECYKSSHDCMPVDTDEATKRMNDSIKPIRDLNSYLHQTVTRLEGHLFLSEQVISARQESLAALEKAKETAENAILNAYKNSRESLMQCWKTLELKSSEFREWVERTKARALYTTKYCSMALDSNDTVGLLPQIDAVHLAVQARLEEARQLKEPVDPSKMVKWSVRLPGDLDSIASGWFDQAKVVNDEFNFCVNDVPDEENSTYYTKKELTLKELEKLCKSLKDQQQTVQLARLTEEKLKAELTAKDQLLEKKDADMKKLQEQYKELQGQLESQLRTSEQWQSDFTKKTQELLTYFIPFISRAFDVHYSTNS